MESVTVSTMTWLRNDCCKWLWICCCCCSWLITGFVARVTRQVPHIEHELLTLVKHMCSPLVLCRVPVARSLVLYVMSSFVLFRLVIPSSLLLLLRNLVTPWYLHTFPTFIFFPCLIATKPNWITNTTIKTKKMYWHTPHRFSIIFRDFKFSKLSPMVCIICNYLPSVRYLLVVLREYTFKVHIFVSSEHTVSRVIYVLFI